MAKFCRYCGTEIPESGACTCAEGIAAQNDSTQTPPPQAVSTTSSPIVLAFQNILPFFKAFVKNPLSATKIAVERKELWLSMILVLIHGILTGAYLFLFAQRMIGNLGTILSDIAQSISEWNIPIPNGAGFYDTGKLDFSVPFFGVLFWGIFLTALLFVITALVIFLVGKITKSQLTFTGALIAVGVNTIYLILCTAAALILLMMSFRFSFVALLLGFFAWVVSLVIVAQGGLGVEANGKFFTSLIVGICILGAVCAFSFIKVVPAAYGPIEVEGMTLNEALEMLEDNMF